MINQNYGFTESIKDCRIMVALILSTLPFTRRSFFFIPPAIMALMAMELVNLSSARWTGFSGKVFLSTSTNSRTSGAVSESSFSNVLGIPITNWSTDSFCWYDFKNARSSCVGSVSSGVAIMPNGSVTARPVLFFP